MFEQRKHHTTIIYFLTVKQEINYFETGVIPHFFDVSLRQQALCWNNKVFSLPSKFNQNTAKTNSDDSGGSYYRLETSGFSIAFTERNNHKYNVAVYHCPCTPAGYISIYHTYMLLLAQKVEVRPNIFHLLWPNGIGFSGRQHGNMKESRTGLITLSIGKQMVIFSIHFYYCWEFNIVLFCSWDMMTTWDSR